MNSTDDDSLDLIVSRLDDDSSELDDSSEARLDYAQKEFEDSMSSFQTEEDAKLDEETTEMDDVFSSHQPHQSPENDERGNDFFIGETDPSDGGLPAKRQKMTSDTNWTEILPSDYLDHANSYEARVLVKEVKKVPEKEDSVIEELIEMFPEDVKTEIDDSIVTSNYDVVKINTEEASLISENTIETHEQSGQSHLPLRWSNRAASYPTFHFRLTFCFVLLTTAKSRAKSTDH